MKQLSLLTEKEIALLQRYADGENMPHIAQALNLTLFGLKAAFKIIRKKLGASNTAHAAVIAVRRSLID